MSKPGTQADRAEVSFFIFSRLFLQPDGSFLAKPCGIYPAETLEHALAAATAQAHSRGPLLFRLEQILHPEPVR